MTSIDLLTQYMLSYQFRKLFYVTYSIKMSAMMFIPRNIQMSQNKYMTARKGRDNVVMPGRKTKL